MITRKQNQLLCEKMEAEQAAYRSWLLSLPPEEILNHTFEYTVKQEILIKIKELLLPRAQAAALLASPAPLADVYKDFCNIDVGLMGIMWACIQKRAKKLLEEQG